MGYQIYKADYCLKHFKLVLFTIQGLASNFLSPKKALNIVFVSYFVKSAAQIQLDMGWKKTYKYTPYRYIDLYFRHK